MDAELRETSEIFDDLKRSCESHFFLAADLSRAQAFTAEGKSAKAAAIASFALSQLGFGYFDVTAGWADDTGQHLVAGQFEVRDGDEAVGAATIVGVLASRLSMLEDACRKHGFPMLAAPREAP
jgi:hypothetical protein